jgi:hypothetical protein
VVEKLFRLTLRYPLIATGYKLWKARILLKMGRKAEALATAQEGVKLAEVENNKEYVYLNQVVVEQAKK